jgi:hypothetical protein
MMASKSGKIGCNQKMTISGTFKRGRTITISSMFRGQRRSSGKRVKSQKGELKILKRRQITSPFQLKTPTKSRNHLDKTSTSHRPQICRRKTNSYNHMTRRFRNRRWCWETLWTRRASTLSIWSCLKEEPLLLWLSRMMRTKSRYWGIRQNQGSRLLRLWLKVNKGLLSDLKLTKSLKTSLSIRKETIFNNSTSKAFKESSRPQNGSKS